MKLSPECLPCLLNQAVRMAKVHIVCEEDQLRLIKRVMGEMSAVEANTCAPYVAHRIQRILKDILQNPDPCREDKLLYNTEMLKLEGELGDIIHWANDPLGTALKLAAAGNIIDFGPGHDISPEIVRTVIDQTLKQVFPADTFKALESDLQASRRLLYLGDNAGEIVFDKMFIRTIREVYPGLEIDFATRGEAVLNDITEEDAYQVGMDDFARIINNGTDIPGTILEYCAPDFVSAFTQADMIIAKGQGNFESLCGSARDKLYYVFLCKCNRFMERMGAQKNDIMLIREQ